MSAEPDLLPLPRVLVHVPHEGDMEMEAVGNYYEASKVREVIATKDAEVEALRAYKTAWQEYNDKTEWVQQTAKPRELGHHRADVLRQRIEQLEAALEATREDARALGIVRALPEKWRASPEGTFPDSVVDCAADLDAAIDQARGKGGGEVEGD